MSIRINPTPIMLFVSLGLSLGVPLSAQVPSTPTAPSPPSSVTAPSGPAFPAQDQPGGTDPLATVDLSQLTSPSISYDQSPYLFLPDLPEHMTTVYTDGTSVPPLFDPYLAQEPAVVVVNPDTYSLSPASVYYTAPTDPAGPYKTYSAPPSLYFDFGPGAVAPGYTQVLATTAYGPDTGYGWGDTSKVIQRDRATTDPLTTDFCSPSGTPFYVDLPNGMYDVSVTVGDSVNKSNDAVRAQGALELYSIGGSPGTYGTDTFRVRITNGRLRLELMGAFCPLNALVITPTTAAELSKVHLYIASDSTASKYSKGSYPLTGWGVPMQNYFTSAVEVDDLAKPGRSSKSFYEEKSLDAITNVLQPGDFLFVMDAINDSADDKTNRKTNPATTFKAYLRVYVNAALAKGAIPVFVTSQTKRTYDAFGEFTNSVGAYPQSMRDLGAELSVPVIDLNRMSIDFFTALGPTESKNSWMYIAPGQYPGWPNGDSDYIHFQYHGADQLARLIVESIKEQNIQPLAQYVQIPRPEATRY